jgi:hypothetical protein
MRAEEVERFIEAIKAISEQVEQGALRKYAEPARSVYAAGVSNLRDELVEGLDVREFVSADSKQAVDENLVETMTAFCFKWCAHSREQDPGTHAICTRCPLAPHTVQRIARGANAAAGR